jgi:hypothetical protein
MQENVICVGLPNTMAVSRVLNAVFLSRIFGMLAIINSCFAPEGSNLPLNDNFCIWQKNVSNYNELLQQHIIVLLIQKWFNYKHHFSD